MRIPRLFIDQPLSSGAVVELTQFSSNYLCKVLRMEQGRALRLFNGEGGSYEASVAVAHPKRAMALIGEYDSENNQSPLDINLGIAVSKGDRFDFVVQKATELGVSNIQPLLTDFVDVKFNAERAEKKLTHWRGIVVSACEQSGRNILPDIRPLISLSKWCESLNGKHRILLDPEQSTAVKDLKLEERRVSVLIGPEGGFSDQELQASLQQYGFSGVKLGPRVLRTETAPLAIISILQSLWGDL